jgi:electron transport complex protein RnfG
VRKPSAVREIVSIALSLTAVCTVGALLLGVTSALTDRARRAAQARAEHDALASLLDLAPGDRVLAIGQAYRPAARVVVYTLPGENGTAARTFAFDLDGRRVTNVAAAAGGDRPLGRLFVARRGADVHGFVIEGETQGYKNRIRFLVGIDDSMCVTGVRVIEHEEDPGLGAEVARPWFDGQFIGRSARAPAAFTVAKDPMPEDWRTALETLDRVAPAEWRRAHAERVAQENAHPLYAVTGATISSRALTDGVRGTLAHFQRRWGLLAPALAETP